MRRVAHAVWLLVAIPATLAACTDQRPLSDIERALWATDVPDVPDVIPRPPALQALAGKRIRSAKSSVSVQAPASQMRQERKLASDPDPNLR